MDPAGDSAPRPRYRLALRALAMRVHPTFFDLATPLLVTNLPTKKIMSAHESHAPLTAFSFQRFLLCSRQSNQSRVIRNGVILVEPEITFMLFSNVQVNRK